MPFASSQSVAVVGLIASVSIAGAAISPEQVEFFESRIRPVLAQECYECHSAAGKKKGGLLLDSREGWMSGGESGDVIVPGKPAESLLLKSIRHEDPDLKMPRNGAKLEPPVLKDFEKWIAMGAPDPRDRPPTKEELAKETDWKAVMERRKGWWCFQPIQDSPAPMVKDSAWSSHPIDRFLLAQIEAQGLKPAADVNPRTLYRRLSYVLTGLPPSPEEVDAFVKDAAHDPESAVNGAVDRLLSSPRFGEKWARHWMDWVRYAETHGSEGDPQIPFAWRYRDYLIRALNGDVPYPQLVKEHIAGDLLPQPRVNREVGINESALGPAHFRMVLHGFTPTDPLDEQVTFTDNQIDTVSKAFLGLTVSCARCHNHKFDAISQADFYALYGVMVSTRPATIDVNLPEREREHVAAMSALKSRIKDAVAANWLEKIEEVGAKLQAWKPDEKQRAALINGDAGSLGAWLKLTELPLENWAGEWKRQQLQVARNSETLRAFRNQQTFARWDLRTDEAKRWIAEGSGVSGGATERGEFTIANNGDRVIRDILPRGIYSHRFSDKQRGVLQSPPLKSEGGKVWVRIRGEGNARARYVVQHYPRTGTVYARSDINSAADQWINWPLDYWKGDQIFFEFTTDADQPVEAGNSERSWLGITEVIYARDEKGPVPPPPGVPLHAVCDPAAPAPANPEQLAALYVSALRKCVEAWKDGNITDEQAEFLGQFVRLDLLPNTSADLGSVAGLIREYRDLEAKLPSPTRAPGLIEGFPRDQELFVRGSHKQPADPVPRRFLDALDPTPLPAAANRSGRLELAERFVSRSNPLPSRVLANRVWHHLYGRGLVATPDNFGRLGELPTHPELLDHLAAYLDAHGGSMKQLIRYIVTCRGFRLESRASADALERDPENRLLSHFPSRRLEAEAIRDSMLALTGKLECNDGAPADGNSYRRTVYTRVIRNNLDGLLTAFDFPTPSATRGRRDETNVPAQALALLNDPAVIKWAGDWSERIVSEPTLPDDGARVRRMFQEAFGREPSESEKAQTIAFLAKMGAEGIDQPGAWRNLAQTLFNAKEFLYLG